MQIQNNYFVEQLDGIMNIYCYDDFFAVFAENSLNFWTLVKSTRDVRLSDASDDVFALLV